MIDSVNHPEEVFAKEAAVLAVACPRCSSSDYNGSRCFDCGYPTTTPVEVSEDVEVSAPVPAEQLPLTSVATSHPFTGFNLAPPTPEEAAAARAECDRRMAAGETESI